MLGKAGNAAATAFRAELDLGNAPIPDLRRIIASRTDVVLIERPLSIDLDGAYAYDEPLHLGFIYLNARPIWTRRRFTMAHELGHHSLAHRSGIDKNIFEVSSDPQEIEANAFAAELLMPAAGVHSAPRVHDRGDVAELAAHFLVSGRAMIVRLHALGLISDALRRNLEQSYDPKFYRDATGADVPDRRDASRTTLPEVYQRSVLQLYMNGGITYDAAREALDLTQNEAQDVLPSHSDEDEIVRRANAGVGGGEERV